MKITVFTSNQPRHLALVRRLASVSEVTYAILECNTVFPGQVGDFYKKTEVMQEYFSHVTAAEKQLYGDIAFTPNNVKTLAIKGGDLNLLSPTQLEAALSSDIYVVFGASYIKGWLIDYLVSKKAINIHMGISPYYRGSSCNFWALYDQRPSYVGATIHLLSKGLDSGPMLYHAIPTFDNNSPFVFTMKAVEAAQESLVARIDNEEIFNIIPEYQDENSELRYTRNADFTDDVAREFLNRQLSEAKLSVMLSAEQCRPELLSPFYF